MSVSVSADEPPAPPDAAIDTRAQLDYWNSVDASDNGMLGGFAHVSRVDIQGSRNFIAKLRLKPGNSATPTTSSSSSSSSPSSGRPRIADCGAGIGRITKGLLSTLNDGRVVVDIVEPVAKFTAAVAAGEDFAPLRDAGRIGDVYNVGLEQWEPREAAYWIIWNQWCLGHLTDAALVAHLRRCGKGVAPGGVVIVKENVCDTADDVFDQEDSSVTRTDRKFRALFREAGLKVVRTEVQRGMPRELYAVRSYALRVF